MSGETESAQSAWTVDTIKAYFDMESRLTAQFTTMQTFYERQIMDERDRRYDERWKAQESASTYAQEKSNEFRGSLDDLSTKQATKLELAQVVTTVNDKLDLQHQMLSELRSRMDVGPPALLALQQQVALSAGVSQGQQITMGKIYAAIAALGGVLAIIVLLSNGVFK